MKESVLDILIHLFENFLEAEDEPEPSRDALKQELEHAGYPEREVVIDRLLALDADDIDIEQVKWVVLMVLFSQPGQEQAYERMEDLVFEERRDAMH